MKDGVSMKKVLSLLMACLILTGCGNKNAGEIIVPEAHTSQEAAESVSEKKQTDTSYQSRFGAPTIITLSDDGILVDQLDSGSDEDAVKVTHDIIYYENRETYDSGNPYGEGADWEQHEEAEAAAHTVVNITKPGAYRVEGKLSAGQIRVDLGKDAEEDPNAVVELILDNADITCTVAPAILFLNVYECDGDRDEENATPQVNTSAAGANLILQGSSTVNGSHVAKIFKDKEGEKKLWKQDAAIYSYMSMNIDGPGSLVLTADNEGMGTEMHLTINGGSIHIYSGNDGINTNEDNISVTAIHDGNLTIFAGLGAEGDGIDSNGYLVINGGSVVSAANPKSDAGLDSNLGSFIHGGTVIAMGSTMDWAESDSQQVTMNLQFAGQQKAGSKVTITKKDGTEIFSFESDSEYARNYSGLILSHGEFHQGETYHVYIDGVQMAYTGNDVGRGAHGGKGQPPEMPEGMEPPKDFDPSKMGGDRGQRPENWEDMVPPEGFGREMPARPEGEILEMPEDRFPNPENGEKRTDFYMNDKVNAFSGVTAAE